MTGGNMEIYQLPGTVIRFRLGVSFATPLTTHDLVTSIAAKFVGLVALVSIPPWMMALLIGGLLDRVKERFEAWGIFICFFFFQNDKRPLLLPRSKKMSKFPGLLPPSLLKPTNQWTILPASDSPSCPRDNRERGMDRCIGTEQT